MNERIKELRKQAIDFCLDKGSQGNLSEEVAAKFAELIVGECMRMCDVAAIGYESHGHMKEANGCYSAKEYIADWFEVEQ